MCDSEPERMPDFAVLDPGEHPFAEGGIADAPACAVTRAHPARQEAIITPNEAAFGTIQDEAIECGCASLGLPARDDQRAGHEVECHGCLERDWDVAAPLRCLELEPLAPDAVRVDVSRAMLEGPRQALGTLQQRRPDFLPNGQQPLPWPRSPITANSAAFPPRSPS